jgi:hypothetical protein
MEVEFPGAVAGYEDLVGKFERTLTLGKGSLGFDFHREGGFLRGIQLVKAGCTPAVGLSESAMAEEFQGSH